MKTAIIIPTYNRPELLKRAIDSAFRQSRRPDEVIVVNDGDSLQVEWRPGLKILHTKGQQGPTIARNIGIKNTDCDAIFYLDDDDELLPNHIQELIKPLEKGHSFAFSKAIYRYADGFETEDPEPNNHDPNKSYYDPYRLLSQNIAPISSFGHVKTAWKQIGCWDANLIRMEDWDFWGRMFIEFGTPYKVDKVTNIIHKGTGANRTDSNQFVYSMACSWGDIVRDRLRCLADKGTGIIDEETRKRYRIPTVGVVMPVYNAGPYLLDALNSLKNQKYDDFEIIAINDGSTDKSGEVLKQFAATYPKLRVFHQQHAGVTRALNYGVLLSRSKYIARMDADDVAFPQRLERQVDFMEKNKDVYVLGSWFYSMDESLQKLIWPNQVEEDHESIRKTLLERCCIGHPTVMMRRQLFEVLGGYSEAEEHKHIEDYELWLRASQRFKLANLPENLLAHRTHNQQVSSVSSNIQKANAERLKQAYRSIK